MWRKRRKENNKKTNSFDNETITLFFKYQHFLNFSNFTDTGS